MKHPLHDVTTSLIPSTFYIAILFFIFSSCQKERQESFSSPTALSAKENPKTLKDFVQTNLVGDNDEYDPMRIDPLLKNGWGIAMSPTGTVWISAEATGVSTVYDREGNQVLPAVTIPSPGGPTGGHPTGQVFNSGTGFNLPNGSPARFIFVGPDGVISGWNGGTGAVAVINDPGEVYLGVTIANDGANKYLYVANFSENEIEVFDVNWQEVDLDFEDPDLPDGYAPFNIQNIDNKLYVMYAKVGVGEEEPGPGNGYVDIYNPDGTLVKRFISRGQLNAPWGVAKAPASFWSAENTVEGAILVGNFGDGHINAYSSDGAFMGQLRAHGNPIVIEGLWAITFAPTTSTIDPNRLYFAAGPDDEEHGLFGYIKK